MIEPKIENIGAFRNMAAETIRHACDGGEGLRGLDDPIYALVASMQADRDKGRSRNETRRIEKWKAPFSSCAFLCHYLLETLFREDHRPDWIGREAKQPLSRLMWEPAPAKTYRKGSGLHPGDIIGIWPKGDGNKAHVLTVISYDPETHVLISGEYGQPHGAIKKHNISNGLIGRRKIQRVLPLAKVLDQVAEIYEKERPKNGA